jgi:endonuclease/exonuclease/phosphatase family metal-dependent hydrolase
MRKLLLGALLVATFALPLPASAGTTEGTGKGIRIVNLNILHGVFCERETNGCQARDRVALLAQQLEESDCPEVVGLQEVNRLLAKELKRARKTMCDGKYKTAFTRPPRGVDTERVFTTLPIQSQKVIKLTGGFRTASRVVLKSPLGPLVLVVTHQDGTPDVVANNTCSSCKPPCSHDRSVYDCQTDAAVGLADETGGSNAIRVLMGDFNVNPSSDRYKRVVSEGWTDSYLAAGNPECNSASGVGCTSGREDQTIVALKDPNAKESERIDFIFVKAPAGCVPAFDPAADNDGDGLGTGLFFPEPATDGPGGLVWVSDHTGVSADFSCGT